jgi:hypothetical protein
MAEPTVTISLRVPKPVKDLFDQIAKSQGQLFAEWGRDQLMQAAHRFNPQLSSELAGHFTGQVPPNLLRAFEDRLQKTEETLRQDIAAVKTEIGEVAKAHRQDLCRTAEVGMNVEQSMEERIQMTSEKTQKAIERLEKRQRSSTNRILHAIGEITELSD